MKQNEPVFGTVIKQKDMIVNILKINPEDISNVYPIQIVSTGLPCVVIPLNSLDAIKKCTINHDLCKHFIENIEKCNLLVFALDADNEFQVRVFMFVPGFLEDPATGSANGNLAGYLLKHHYFNKNTIQYTVSQGREINRPSLIRIEAQMAGGSFHINVGGNVHLIAEGT